MKQEFIRSPYNYDSDKLSDQTGLLCKDESLTEQEHLEEADINYVAERFMRTGMLPQILDLPEPGDFEGVFDFQTAMNQINHARDEFMSLPARVRSRFDNDPSKLLEFVHDRANYDEAVAMGFIPKKETTNETGTGSTTETTAQVPQGTTRTASNAQNAPTANKPGSQAGQDAGG